MARVNPEHKSTQHWTGKAGQSAPNPPLGWLILWYKNVRKAPLDLANSNLVPHFISHSGPPAVSGKSTSERERQTSTIGPLQALEANCCFSLDSLIVFGHGIDEEAGGRSFYCVLSSFVSSKSGSFWDAVAVCRVKHGRCSLLWTFLRVEQSFFQASLLKHRAERKDSSVK